MPIGFNPKTSLPVLLMLSTASASAWAGNFAEDGTYLPDPTAVAVLDFEQGPMGVADEASLSGSRVFKLSPFSPVNLDVTLPQQRRTYRVSAWIRDRETIADFEIWYSDRVNEVSTLYPTGRITSDGWVELANSNLRIDGTRLTKATVGFLSPDGGAIDAIEIVPDGDETDLPVVPNAPCKGATDASACDVGQVCVWSECRNVNGWVPPIPGDRDLVTAYLEGRFKYLFGPFAQRTLDLPQSIVALDQMRYAEDPWTYWNGFLLAVRRLHDGHTSTSGLPDFVLENPKPLALCFLEGDADLSHGVEPKDPDYLDVLVSHTGADHNLGLQAGDRLVRVDGQHPIAWARSLISVYWSPPPTSNHETYAELASALRSMISRYAHTLEVIRCDDMAGTCGNVEVISMDDVPLDPAGTPFDYVACDNRPVRHLADSPANHQSDPSDKVYSGIVVESDDVERIYGLEWESLYTSNGSDGVGAALSTAVFEWKANARGVILDHRLGFGGTVLAPQILWQFCVPFHANDYYEDRQFADDEQPTLMQGQAKFNQAVASGAVLYAGSPQANLNVPVALLITEDVSASDWLPLGMKGAPKTRIFGPFQTNGAFSTRYAFGYWLGMNYVMAVGDTFAPDGSTLNGRGVQPDVVVLPKQSDLLVGKDTVYEAALDWVRSELLP